MLPQLALLLASASAAVALFSQGTIADRDYSIQFTGYNDTTAFCTAFRSECINVYVGALNYHHQLDCVVSQSNPLYAYCGGKYKTDGDESGSGESYDFTTEICPAMSGCNIVGQPKNATAQYSAGAGQDEASSTVVSSVASTDAKDASSAAVTTSSAEVTNTAASSSSALATAEDAASSPSSAEADLISSTSSISMASLASATAAVETITSTASSSSSASASASASSSASAESSAGVVKVGVSALMVVVGFVGVVGMFEMSP